MSYWQSGACQPTYVYKSKSSFKTKKQKECSPEQHAYGQYDWGNEVPSGSGFSGPMYYTYPQQFSQQLQTNNNSQYYVPVTENVPYDQFFEKKKQKQSLKEKRKQKKKQNNGNGEGKRGSIIPGLTMLGGAPVFWKLIEYGLNKAKEYSQQEDEDDYDTSSSSSSLAYQPYYGWRPQYTPQYQQPYYSSIPMQISYIPTPPPPAPPPLQRPFKKEKFIRELPPKVITLEDAISTDQYGARRFQLFLDLKGFYPNEVKIKTENKMLHVCGKKERDVSKKVIKF